MAQQNQDSRMYSQAQGESRETQHGIGAGSLDLEEGSLSTARVDSIKVKTFVGRSWHLWKFKMQQYLELMEIWGYVSGEIALPPDSAPEKARKTWRRKDLTARNVLINAVDEERLQMLTSCKTSQEMWQVLTEKYEVVSIANEMRLDEEFSNVRQGSNSVSSYIKELTAAIDNLRGIGKVITDRGKVLSFLKGLNDDYSVLSIMLEHQEGITFEKAKASVLTHESKKKLGGESSTNDGEAYVGFKGGRGRGRGRFSAGRGIKKQLLCFNCNQPGHYAKNCTTMSKTEGVCHNCGGRGHKSYDCPTPKKKHEPENFCAEVIAQGHSASKVQTWIVDSGATHHMCNEKEAFSELKENQSAAAVLVGNNAKLKVEKEGKVSMGFTVGKDVINGEVDGVLFIPEMGRNLFSVTQTMRQGKSVFFDSQTMSCKILKGKTEVGAAHLEGGLWILDCQPQRTHEAHSSEVNESMELWHQRMGHLGEDNLLKLQRKHMVKGLEGQLRGSVKGSCEGCKEGKQNREPFPEGEGVPRKKLELVQTDIKGPINPPCFGGFRYFLTFLDVCSRKNWVYLLKHKHEAFNHFKHWKAHAERHGECKVKTLRSDQGGEYTSTQFQNYLKECGIKQEFTVARTPQQNGRAERLNRTLMDMSRAMTNGAGLDKKFWGEGVLTSAYLKNRSPHAALEEGITPEEAWSGHKPSIRHLRVFGCKVGVHVPQESRGVVDPKSWNGIHVGYSSCHQGYRIWSPTQRKVIVSRDVIFHENSVLSRNKSDGSDDEDEFKARNSTQTKEVGEDEHQEASQLTSEEIESPTLDGEPQESQQSGMEAQPIALKERRTSERKVKEPVRLSASQLGNLEVAEGNVAMAFVALDQEPTTIEEALNGKNAKEWEAAIQEELKSLKDNKTWEICNKPEGRSVIGCKWVFKLKSPQVPGGPPRFKARLVAKGYSQKHGIDYHETFAPVIKYQSLRLILSIATERDMAVHQMDVKTAFLNGELEEEIYMEIPQGLEGASDGQVLRLRRSLYGLKQSPRCWNKRINDFLEEQGFMRLRTDSAVYTRGEGKNQVILGVYVDDLVILGEDIQQVLGVKGVLSSEFQMVDFGEVSKVLGIRIMRNAERGTLSMDQAEYVGQIIANFDMAEAKELSTPLSSGEKFTLEMCPKNEAEKAAMSGAPYREAIGSLMYLMVSTRPDLAAVVGILSRFLANPGPSHWKGVKRVFRYLNGTKDFGLVFQKTGQVCLEGFSDSDWAGDLDNRRSTSAYVMMLGGGAVSWKSKRQESVALSSTEAEFMASTAACKEVMWMKDFLSELGFHQGTVRMYSDNQSSIKVMKNPVGHSRMKHIELQAYYVRDLIQKEEVEFVFCSTDVQVADSLTKGVPKEKVQLCNKLMGLQRVKHEE